MLNQGGVNVIEKLEDSINKQLNYLIECFKYYKDRSIKVI